MKLHYVTLCLGIELENDVNVYDYIHESFRDDLDVVSFEIDNVETKEIT